MVSDVSEDIGRTAAAAPVESVQPPPARSESEPVSLTDEERTERDGGSIPTNPASAGSGSAGWIFGGIFLILVLAAIVGSSGNQSSAPSATPSWEPPANAMPTPAVSAPAEATTKASEKPPAGSDRFLSSGQIRYCLTEKIRIKAIEGVINADSKSEIYNFNALVRDYNSRCGQFRYRQNEFDRVSGEIEANSASLAQAAKTKWVRDSLGLDDDIGKAAKAAKKLGIPKNSHLDYFGHDWECNRGFRKAGNECAAILLPKDAKLDYLGNDWECIRGFMRNGDGCSSVRPPKNGRLDYLGNDWECNRGFKREAEGCEAVQVPANAKLDYLGNDWECKRGFQKNGNECVPL
jgi:hypothetical protein